MPREILDIDDAARFLGIKKRTMYRLVNTGEIPAKKIGGQWRLSRTQLIQLFREPENGQHNGNGQGSGR